MSFPQFAWACGEEGSDPVVSHNGELVRVDEFALSRHLENQDADLAAIAGLGIRVWRYGMPWRLTERQPGIYDWTLWDRALAACERHGLEPVIDLCHFGLPDHYPGFCDPAWVDGFIRYVEAFLSRYRWPRWFTPINEPFITALSCGLQGAWNDRRRSRADFANALCHVVLADLEANARIRADRGGWWIGAEGFVCAIAADAEHTGDAERIEATAWAASRNSVPMRDYSRGFSCLWPVLLSDRLAVVRRPMYPSGVRESLCRSWDLRSAVRRHRRYLPPALCLRHRRRLDRTGWRSYGRGCRSL